MKLHAKYITLSFHQNIPFATQSAIVRRVSSQKRKLKPEIQSKRTNLRSVNMARQNCQAQCENEQRLCACFDARQIALCLKNRFQLHGQMIRFSSVCAAQKRFKYGICKLQIANERKRHAKLGESFGRQLAVLGARQGSVESWRPGKRRSPVNQTEHASVFVKGGNFFIAENSFLLEQFFAAF